MAPAALLFIFRHACSMSWCSQAWALAEEPSYHAYLWVLARSPCQWNWCADNSPCDWRGLWRSTKLRDKLWTDAWPLYILPAPVWLFAFCRRGFLDYSCNNPFWMPCFVRPNRFFLYIQFLTPGVAIAFPCDFLRLRSLFAQPCLCARPIICGFIACRLCGRAESFGAWCSRARPWRCCRLYAKHCL